MAHKAYGLNELREMYLRFFETKGHLRLPSFPLVPRNDKSILLINAGMSPLHPKVPRDAVLAHCLERRAGFLGAQEELEERELPLLGGENG